MFVGLGAAGGASAVLQLEVELGVRLRELQLQRLRQDKLGLSYYPTCGVWSVECGVWSVESGVRSVCWLANHSKRNSVRVAAAGGAREPLSYYPIAGFPRFKMSADAAAGPRENRPARR